MKSTKSQIFFEKWALLLGDVLALMLAFFLGDAGGWWVDGVSLSDGFTQWWTQTGMARFAIFSLVGSFTVLWFWGVARHYTQRTPFWDELRDTLHILLLAAVLDAAFVFLSKWPFSRLWLLTTWSLVLVLVPVGRGLTKKMLVRAGLWIKPSVIIGTGENAQEAFAAFQSERLMGYEIVAFLALDDQGISPSGEIKIMGRSVPVLPFWENQESALKVLGNPHVIVALEDDQLKAQESLLRRLSFCCLDMNVIPPLRGLPLFGMELRHFFSHEVLLLSLRNNLARRGPRLVKRCFDIAVSGTLLTMLAPMLLFIAWRVGFGGGFPIFGHGRIGQHGKEFKCYKFRSMVPNAAEVLRKLLESDPVSQAEWAKDFKLKNDPRITPFGAFLRRTSLDELPQLWNVFKGEMSLVGPRPIVAEELKRYGDDAPYYLEAKPGISGLWQVSGRNDVNYDSRVFLDAWYVKNWSLWYDIVILLKTVKVVFKREGAY